MKKRQALNRFVDRGPARAVPAGGAPAPSRLGGLSIRARLTGIGLFFILGTSLAMAFVGFRLTTGFMQERTRHNFELLAASLARNAEIGILLENPPMLDTLARNMLALEEVEEVVIEGASGRILLRQGKESPARPPQIRVSAPVESEGISPEGLAGEEPERQQIGMVHLLYSGAGLDRQAREMAGRFLLLALLLAAAPVMLYWMIARAIVAPLKNLLALTREVSRGRLDIRADGGSLPETRALALTFNEMLDALNDQRTRLAEAHSRMARQEALAELGKFSMMVAHEIKNPLAIIKGSLDLLKKDEIDPETKATVGGYLDEEVDRINRLIEDFLLFARPSPPALSEVAVAEFLGSLVNRLSLAQQEGGLQIDLAPIDPELVLLGDPNLLERAIGNIVRNAAEAGATTVRLSGRIEDGHFRLSIADNGPGVSEEAATRLFEPFFTTKAKGSGLGLAMVREIVEAHGGRIEFESGADGGAVFVVQLPLAGISERE